MKNKTNYLLLVIILAVNILDTYSQQTDTVKTVFELFNLPPEGCEFSNYEEVTEEVSLMVDLDSYKQNEKKEKDLAAIMEKYTPLFERSDKISAKFEKQAQAVVKFKNGNHSFKKANKYGLMNAKGKILIPAQFHTIIQDGETGFIAYKNQVCNYYSNVGKKLLSRDYYYIKPTVKNSLIVQTKEGFGVISKQNKIIVAPAYFQIKEVFKKEQFYYWIRKSKDIGFYLSENTKDTIRLNAQPSEIRFIDTVYWENFGDLINTKTKRNVICGGHYVEVVSYKHQLARISDKKTRAKYLMKFNGDLVTDQSFVSIGSFNETNYAVASLKKDRKILYGVIDQTGNWIVSPQYFRLQFINDSMLIVSDINRKSGIINIKNDMVIPFKYMQVKQINERYALGINQENKEIHSEVIDLQNLKIIKSDLPYSSISTTKRCNAEVFIAKESRKECVVSNNFEQISPACYTRVFYGPDNNSFIGTDFLENNNRQSQVFNCDGKLLTVKIKRKKYNTFYNYEEITPELHHIMLSTDTGYFVNANGKVVENNNHWQHIEYSNAKDLFTTMKYGGKYGIINSLGETIIPTIFEYISTFDEKTGLARYNFNNKQKGCITTDGKLLFGTKYLETKLLDCGVFKVKKNEKWGVVNLNGDEIVAVKYSKIWLNGGIIYAELGKSIEYFDLYGNLID